jgi:hypothetical protein
MLIFCNTPNESQLNAARPNCDNVILLQNFLDGPAEWFCLVRDARSMTTMNWFRTRARLGAYLALFALAFQLAVSFGHVHLERVAPIAAGASALAGAPPAPDDLNGPSDPTGREGLADDHCPICTLIHLAGALVPAEMPSLPLPAVFGRLRLEAAADFDLTASHGALFRARAPPIA